MNNVYKRYASEEWVEEKLNNDIPDSLTIDLTDTEQGTAAGINADTLGGKVASDYVLEDDFDAYKSKILSEYATKSEIASEYLRKNETAADSTKLGGKPPEYYIQPRNLLDNSDFEVAQAGYNGLHGNELYHADRWWGNGIGSLSVSGTVKTFASISGFAIMRQTLWNDGRDHGKTYTLVVTLPDGTRLVGSGKSPSAPSTSEQVFIDITAPDSKCWFMLMKMPDDVMCVRVDASQIGASVSFLHMDLFEGVYTAESAPPHLPKGYVAELAECQRYYVKYPSRVIIPCTTSSAQTLTGVLYTPVAMIEKTIPTITVGSMVAIRGCGVTITDINVDGYEVEYASGNLYSVRTAISGTTLENGQVYQMYLLDVSMENDL